MSVPLLLLILNNCMIITYACVIIGFICFLCILSHTCSLSDAKKFVKTLLLGRRVFSYYKTKIVEIVYATKHSIKS